MTKLLEQSVLNYPRTAEKNILFRLDILKKAEKDKLLQAQLVEICKRDILFWINVFCYTKDPRRVPDVLPFCSYEFQDYYIKEVERAINFQYDQLTDKSRDMGVSWCCLYVIAHKWQFEPGSDFRIGSRKEEFVDKPKVMDTLFEKLRFNLSRQPIWLMPRGFNWREHSSFMKLYNPELGNTIIGESANNNFGSGGRSKAILLDEFSKWDKNIQDAAWTSTADVTNCRLPVSTPLGSGNKFAVLAKGTKEKIRKISLHWTLHPLKAEGVYYIDKGHRTILIDSNKKAYELWKDGVNVRSPWYDAEDDRRSSADLAQEVDIDYHASGYPFFDLPSINEQRVWTQIERRYPEERLRPGCFIRANLYDRDGSIEMVEEDGGFLKIYELPEKGHDYVVGADTSEGLPKGDEAACVVRNKYSRNVVAVANGLYPPDDWAIKLERIGRYYRSADVAPENNNHGYSVCSDLKKTDCKLYYTEREAADGSKRIVKAGWTTDARSRPQMLDQLEEDIRRGSVELRDENLIDQCRTFVKNDKGKPEADGDFLDDLVIACGIAGDVIQKKPHKPDTTFTEAAQRQERRRLEMRTKVKRF